MRPLSLAVNVDFDFYRSSTHEEGGSVNSNLVASMTMHRGMFAPDSGDLSLPAELVRGVARQLHTPSGGQGHAVFRGGASDLGVPWARLFQLSLLRAVWKEMSRRNWIPFSPDEVRLNQFEANDGRLPREIVGDVVTFKRLHFDPYSVVFAHLYQPTENLTGGTISLVDVRRYLRETRIELADAFDPLHAPGHNGRLVARDEHRALMLEKYAFQVEPPGPDELLLLLIRNDAKAGVAHEIAEVHSIDTTMPTSRRFFRASIAPHH